MKINLNSILASFPPEKSQSDSLWAKIIIRRLSLYLAWMLMNLGFSAFAVSMISLLLPIAAFGLWLNQQALIAIILLNLWLLLDCVDGNIARASGGSKMGEFVDATSGYVMVGLSYLGIGVYLDSIGTAFMGLSSPDFTIIGALTSILSLLARLYYQKYKNVRIDREADISERIVNESSLIKVIDHNVSIGGFFTPLLLLAFLLNLMPQMLLLYAVYTLVYFTGSALILLKRANQI